MYLIVENYRTSLWSNFTQQRKNWNLFRSSNLSMGRQSQEAQVYVGNKCSSDMWNALSQIQHKIFEIQIFNFYLKKTRLFVVRSRFDKVYT